MRVTSRRILLKALAAVPAQRVAFIAPGIVAATVVVSRASAATWPSRPIRLIVPFPPAGSTDILAREIALKLQDALGQPIVVENKPGAGGSIGSAEAARATADGHMLLMGHIGTLAINPPLYPNLAYDPRKSFAPVALMARVPNALARGGRRRAGARNSRRIRHADRERDRALEAGRRAREHAARLSVVTARQR